MPNVRVGLLLDDEHHVAWVRAMLEEIAREPGLELVLVVRDRRPRAASTWRRAWHGRSGLLYRAWRSADRYLSAVAQDAFAKADLSPLIGHLPRVDVVAPGGDPGHLTGEDIDRIRHHHPDVLLKLGFDTLGGDVLSVARAGVWSFQRADTGRRGGALAGVWEVLLQEPTMGTTLERLTERRDGTQVLYRSYSSTDPFSVQRSVNSLFWKSLAFVPRRLRELRDLGADAFFERHSAEPARRDRPAAPAGTPRTLHLAYLLTRLVWRRIRHKFSRLARRGQWVLYYHFGSDNEDVPTSPARYRELRPPSDRFWADPCAAVHEGRHFVFIEELEFRNAIGRIAVIAFADDGTPQLPAQTVLSAPTHFSYPFVFSENGDWYMIPESIATRTVPLYRASRFPDQWEFVMNLMEDVVAVDATVWHHAGKYWLFATVREHEGAPTDDELFLFFADTLQTTEWRPHTLNPIVSDVRCARPAGRIFFYDGQWYRPAQDSSGRYGRALAFHRIDTISETEYAETRIAGIEPDWDPGILGTHTYSRAGRLTVIDAERLGRRRRYS